jgi:hypothetical protein
LAGLQPLLGLLALCWDKGHRSWPYGAAGNARLVCWKESYRLFVFNAIGAQKIAQKIPKY